MGGEEIYTVHVTSAVFACSVPTASYRHAVCKDGVHPLASLNQKPLKSHINPLLLPLLACAFTCQDHTLAPVPLPQDTPFSADRSEFCEEFPACGTCESLRFLPPLNRLQRLSTGSLLIHNPNVNRKPGGNHTLVSSHRFHGRLQLTDRLQRRPKQNQASRSCSIAIICIIITKIASVAPSSPNPNPARTPG